MADPRECQRFADDLSGFVDHTLPERRLTQVLQHLERCPSCRETVAGIRTLRSRLSTSVPPCPGAPMSLTERLARIAGEECDEPLYLSSGRSCPLPTRRQQVRRRLTRSGSITVVILATLLGLTLALGHEPAAMSDPVGEAREQYYLAITSISVNEGVGAAMWARERGVSSPLSHVESRATNSMGRTVPVAQEEALEMLGSNRHQVTFSGMQRVWMAEGNGMFRANDVKIDEVAGQGASLTVLDGQGQAFLSWFVPTLGCCGSSVEPDREFHGHTELQIVAGRGAHVLEARRGDAVDARWWIDSEQGVVLWFERYDSAGEPTVVAGFLDITFGEAEIDQQAVVTLGLQAATTADRTGWCQGLERCPMTLAGLPLVAYATSAPGEPPRQRLVYSDGVRSLSVSWVPGRIGDVNRMEDDTLGQPHVNIWQAGDGVISVATADSRALLTQACGELPDEEGFRFGLGERFASGLKRVLGIG